MYCYSSFVGLLLLLRAAAVVVGRAVLPSTEGSSSGNPSDPYLYNFLVGDVKVWSMIDTSGKQKPYTYYFPDQKVSDFDGVTDIYSRPYIDEQGRFTKNTAYSSFLIESQEQLILVDSALGVVLPITPPDQTIRVPDLISAAGFELEEIDYVVHSHLHRDHTGWDVDFGEGKTIVQEFPNADFLMYEVEWNYWTSTPQLKNTSAYDYVLRYIQDQLELVPTGDYAITSEVKIIPCPGHTPGHACVEINSKNLTAIITGDVIHHPVQVQMWAWKDVFDINHDLATATRQALIKRISYEMILTIAYHFTHPSIGRIIPYHEAPEGQSGYIFVPF